MKHLLASVATPYVLMLHKKNKGLGKRTQAPIEPRLLAYVR